MFSKKIIFENIDTRMKTYALAKEGAKDYSTGNPYKGVV